MPGSCVFRAWQSTTPFIQTTQANRTGCSKLADTSPRPTSYSSDTPTGCKQLIVEIDRYNAEIFLLQLWLSESTLGKFQQPPLTDRATAAIFSYRCSTPEWVPQSNGNIRGRIKDGLCPDPHTEGNDVVNTCDSLDSTPLRFDGAAPVSKPIDWSRTIRIVNQFQT